ncbi:MAG TPA: hypothetical protein VHL59_08970, partial [Thermoanaerobaculia bacterium]|nr:hypothetical protein [Thermoanaerobaculia bacterium]
TAALAAGEPSAAVVARIVDAIDFDTQTQRIRRFARRTAAGVAIMVAAAAAFSAWRILDANQSRQAAMADAAIAGHRAARERRAAADAKAAADAAGAFAASETARALREGRRADAEQQRALAATAEAQRQQEVAFASRLANESTAILRQQPHLIHRSALLAVTAVERLDRIGMRSLGADTALREVLALLPLVEQSTDLPGQGDGDDSELFSEDGRYLAVTRAAQKAIDLCTTADGRCAELQGSARTREGEWEQFSFGSDSQSVAAVFSSANETSLAIWSTATRALLGPEIALPDDPSSLAVGPGGEWVAAALGPGITFFRLEDGKTAESAVAFENADLLRWSRVGRPLLAAAGSDVRLWYPDQPEPVVVLKTKAKIRGAAISPDGSRVAILDQALILSMWEWRKSPEQPLWSLYAANADDVQFSPNGALVAATAFTENTRVVEAASGRVVGVFDGDDAAFSDDGALLLTGATEMARLFRLADGRELAREGHFTDPSIAFRHDGKALSAEAGRKLRVWGPNPELTPEQSIDVGGRVDLVASVPDSDDLVVAIRSRDPVSTSFARISNDGTVRRCMKVPAWIESLAVTNTDLLLTGSKEGTLAAWSDWCSAEPKAIHDARADQPIEAIAVHGTQFAFAAGNTFYVTVRDGVQNRRLKAGVESLAFSADGKTLFTGMKDKWIASWALEPGAIRPTGVYAARTPASQLAPDPNGRYLAATSILTGAEVWDLRSDSPKPITTIRPDWIGVNIAFDPSGRYLLTAGADGIILVWEGWERGAPQAIVREKLSKGVQGATFSRDGKWIVAVTEEKETTLFRAAWQPADLVRIACKSIRETFSPQEWRFVVPGIPYSPPCAGHHRVELASEPISPARVRQAERPFQLQTGRITGFTVDGVKRLLAASPR